MGYYVNYYYKLGILCESIHAVTDLQNSVSDNIFGVLRI